MPEHPAKQPVLATDLDGTLIRSDMMHECFWAALAQDWRAPFLVAAALPGGKAALKARIATLAPVDAAALPYHQPMLDRLHAARAAGHHVALITAADQRHAQAVADHLGLFDSVHASDGQTNLRGDAKAARLRQAFGTAHVTYAGDSRADLPAWRVADAAITVAAPGPLRAQVDAIRPGALHLATPAPGATARAALRALRPHQWLKNILVFVPVLAAHDYAAQTLLAAFLAFVAFSLVASAVYLLNDLLDLAADRAHPRKCTRPLASGALPIAAGMALIPALLGAGLAVALALPPPFLVSLAGYFALTLSYSLFLKRKPLVDICVLAGLYAARVVAGGAATGLEMTLWLLAFSLFLFLALAAVKRQAELVDMTQRGAERAAGRGYRADDLPVIRQIAITSGFVSVLVLMLYLNDADIRTRSDNPLLIGAACLVLIYWLARMVLVAHRGKMDDDPMVHSLRDPISLAALITFAGLFLAATGP